MQKRPFGKTGTELSIIGMGGIVVMGATDSDAGRVVGEAVNRGVNYFDVAPSYGDAEERLGPALAPYRDRVFLACKTNRRDSTGAQEEIEASLKKLKTDHFDLYQLHALTTVEEVEACFAKGGAMEVILKAKEKGQIRYLGFSAHSDEAAMAAMHAFPFDSILFPFNMATWHAGSFGKRTMEEAVRKGIARLALKAMAYGPWQEGQPRHHAKCWYEPITDRKKAAEALRWTLSLGVTAAIPPGEEDLFRLALDIAETFMPLERDEMEAVEKAARDRTPIFRS